MVAPACRVRVSVADEFTSPLAAPGADAIVGRRLVFSGVQKQGAAGLVRGQSAVERPREDCRASSTAQRTTCSETRIRGDSHAVYDHTDGAVDLRQARERGSQFGQRQIVAAAPAPPMLRRDRHKVPGRLAPLFFRGRRGGRLAVLAGRQTARRSSHEALTHQGQRQQHAKPCRPGSDIRSSGRSARRSAAAVHRQNVGRSQWHGPRRTETT